MIYFCHVIIINVISISTVQIASLLFLCLRHRQSYTTDSSKCSQFHSEFIHFLRDKISIQLNPYNEMTYVNKRDHGRINLEGFNCHVISLKHVIKSSTVKDFML